MYMNIRYYYHAWFLSWNLPNSFNSSSTYNHEIQTIQRTGQSRISHNTYHKINFRKFGTNGFILIFNCYQDLHLKGPINQNEFQLTKLLCIVQIPTAQTVAHEVGDQNIILYACENFIAIFTFVIMSWFLNFTYIFIADIGIRAVMWLGYGRVVLCFR